MKYLSAPLFVFAVVLAVVAFAAPKPVLARPCVTLGEEVIQIAMVAPPCARNTGYIPPPIDNTAPSVVSTMPANLAIDVPVNSSVTAVLSELPDPASITTGALVVKNGEQTVPGVVTLSGMSVTFVPTSSLPSGVTLTGYVTPQVTDVQGNHLSFTIAYPPTPYVWQFRTMQTANLVVEGQRQVKLVVAPAEDPKQVDVDSDRLIKLDCPKEAQINDPCKTIWFVGKDGYKHAFPNARVYHSWYGEEYRFEVVDQKTIDGYGLGKNVTYRPGKRMVKFDGSAVVYAVAHAGVLREVATERVATDIYGTDWRLSVDDVDTQFVNDYYLGAVIHEGADYDRAGELEKAPTINRNVLTQSAI
jgi:hypothetical protein